VSVAVVLPALNAARTLERTVHGIPADAAQHLILVDDGSTDGTVALARSMGLAVHEHPERRGYGGNQKSCYRLALETDADVVVMLHPDFQYDPGLVPSLVEGVRQGAGLVLASRFLSGQPLRDGMPVHKYLANRALTGVSNGLLRLGLSEHHTGYRAYSRDLLQAVPWQHNRDDFVFDAQLLAQAVHFGFSVGEVGCPTRYADDSSSIDLANSVIYGVGVLETAVRYRLHGRGWLRSPIFGP
jgi:glycosyltransferase involved in cell wall biosynthesis